MPTVIGTQCAAGSATSSLLDLVLNQDIPQSSPTNGQAILLFFEQWNNSDEGASLISIIDNGVTPGIGYDGQDNTLVAGGTGASGATGTTFEWSLGFLIYGIFKPLLTGDKLTLAFSGVPDYFRVSAFPASGVIFGACDSFEFTGSGPSAGFTNPTTTQSTPFTVAGSQDFAIYVLGEVATPGVGSLSWLDSGIVLLDSWYDDGPSSDSSLICGYQGGIVPGSWDVGGSTDVAPSNADPTRLGAVGYGGTFYQSGAGVSYCSVPGSPCFNARLSLRDPGVGTLTPAAVPMLNGRFRLTDTPDPSTLTPSNVPMLGSRFRLLNQAVR